MRISIEDFTTKIREKLEEGFYPEDYYSFCRQLEDYLSEIEYLEIEYKKKIKSLENETSK